MKNEINKRLKDESLRKRIYQMETILDTALKKLEVLEKSIEDLKEYQEKIRKLEDYYTSKQWKEDFAMDEEGGLPKNLKRGVLSEDGIYDMLERNKEIMKMIDGWYCQK